MPELPEVETIKNILKPVFIGHKILGIDVLRNITIQGDPKQFVNSLVGETFLDITRYGKYLFFHLTNNKVIISHLRMEGKYYEYDEKDKNSYYARVVFHLDNNHKVCYDDSRCFGIMILSSENSYKNEKEIAKLGKEPFEADYKEIFNKVKELKRPIKETILDQTIMAGIGNIYADETLYESKIHPQTQTNLVTLDDWKNIVDNARKILNIAIKMGGSTIKSYHPSKDISGNFQTRIKIYGKSGEICPTCGHEFMFTKVGGRGTTYCPKCQPKKADKLVIGVTGKIASGKSQVLKVFESKGATTFSCDKIVHEIYEDKNVQDTISKMLNIEYSIPNIRENLVNHPENIKKLDKYVHPLVIKVLEKEISKVKKGLVVVEVPLLFEAKMENLFDEIIIVDLDKMLQLQRLEIRNSQSSKSLKTINDKNSIIEKNRNKATYLVPNNGSLEELEKTVVSIFNKLQCRLG